eukprot:g3132.t1
MASTEASHLTALCLVPAEGRLRDKIEAIRRRHDKHHGKWPPHINLMYPFVQPGAALDDAAERLKQALAAAGLAKAPLDGFFDSVQHFKHGRKRFVTWLRPELPGVMEVQSCALRAFPGLAAANRQAFTPHLTIGQATSEDQVADIIADADWLRTGCVFDRLCIIERDAVGEPFRLVHEVPLGKAGGAGKAMAAAANAAGGAAAGPGAAAPAARRVAPAVVRTSKAEVTFLGADPTVIGAAACSAAKVQDGDEEEEEEQEANGESKEASCDGDDEDSKDDEDKLQLLSARVRVPEVVAAQLRARKAGKVLVVVAADCSGSMSGRPWTQVQDALCHMVQVDRSRVALELLAYNHEAKRLPPDLHGLHRAGTTAAIRATKAGGMTCFAAAFDEILRVITLHTTDPAEKRRQRALEPKGLAVGRCCLAKWKGGFYKGRIEEVRMDDKIDAGGGGGGDGGGGGGGGRGSDGGWLDGLLKADVKGKEAMAQKNKNKNKNKNKKT